MLSPGFYGGRRSRQRRYDSPVLFYCPSPAAAFDVVVNLQDGPLWQRSGREGGTTGRVQAPATTAMWPAVLHGGRPVGRRAANRVRPWLLCRSHSGGKMIR